VTQQDLIFRRFNCPPVVHEDEEDKGIWYVVNKSMDAVFGVDNCQKNLRSRKFGIELVLQYLKKARDHPMWNADEILFLKLQRIYECFEGSFLLIFLYFIYSDSSPFLLIAG
jgi:hypothetical protein